MPSSTSCAAKDACKLEEDEPVGSVSCEEKILATCFCLGNFVTPIHIIYIYHFFGISSLYGNSYTMSQFKPM